MPIDNTVATILRKLQKNGKINDEEFKRKKATFLVESIAGEVGLIIGG